MPIFDDFGTFVTSCLTLYGDYGNLIQMGSEKQTQKRRNMSVVVNESTKTYQLPDEGSYLAVLADVIDLGPTATAFGVKDKVQIVWLLDAYDEEGNQFRVSSFYNKSLHEKATLRKDLKSILGTDVTGSFDMETLLGMNNQLVIQHNESDGKTYANIVAILKAPKGKKLEIPAEFERKIDRDGVGSSEKPVNTQPKGKAQRQQPTLAPAVPAAPAVTPAVQQASTGTNAVPNAATNRTATGRVARTIAPPAVAPAAPAPATSIAALRAQLAAAEAATAAEVTEAQPISDEDIPF